MISRVAALLALAVLGLTACRSSTGVPPGPPLPERRTAAADALRALRSSEFEEAGRLAEDVLRRDRDNPFAALVSAISRYKAAMHQLRLDLTGIAASAFRGELNARYLRIALDAADADLARVDEALGRAARFPDLALELCLACWEVDWNGNGRVDDRDRRLLEIERDAGGGELPDKDPRRRPVFRFDHGDVLWARAFVAFQRSLLNLAQAWQWNDANVLLRRRGDSDGAKPRPVIISLDQPARVTKARELLLAGLDLADRTRLAYLAETDDELEWVPSPRQRSHPLPLPVDENLYATWEQVIGDVRRLVRGDEGLSVSELAQLGDHKWSDPPRGFIDIGRMLARPRAITVELDKIDLYARQHRNDREARPEELMRSMLGDYYHEGMKASPLIGRLERMKGEIKRGQESAERKLRYLLWLN